MKERTRRSNKWASAFLLLTLTIGVALTGCSDDETTQPPNELAPPSGLEYLNDNGAVTLDWNASPDAADADGYNVYRSATTMVGTDIAVLNANNKLNANPLTTTNFSDGTAANGVKYFYAVRLQKGSDFSEATSEINTAAREQEGALDLAEFAFTSEPSGLQLSSGDSFTMTSTAPNDNRASIDIYLGTDSPTDLSSAALAIKSPHLVGNSDTDWAGRNADLKELDSFDAPTTSDSGWSDKIVLGSTQSEIVGKVIAIRTPASNGQVHYAKIRIDSVTGTAGNRQITLTRAYQSLPNYVRFEAPRP